MQPRNIVSFLRRLSLLPRELIGNKALLLAIEFQLFQNIKIFWNLSVDMREFILAIL